MRLSREARRQAERYQAASDSERQVAAMLLTLTGTGWRLLVDRRWPGSRTANVDMILIGPPGIYVVDVKKWRHLPRVVDGQLHAGDDQRHGEVSKLLAMSRPAEDALIALQMSPVAVQPLLVFAGHEVDARLGRVRLLGAREVVPALLAEPARMQPAMVRAVATHLEEVFPAYEAPALDPTPESDGDLATPMLLDDTLFDAERLRESSLRAARAQPMESWMTFLHPDQISLIHRRWGGPARISGAAGTGKTVVGLHRAVYLAQRGTGKILFATFVTNLPRVNARLLEQMAPSAAGRIECTNLHRWAANLLQERGVPYRLQRNDDCFYRAWSLARRNGILEQVEPSPDYWKDEIHYVIKGRAIKTFEEYARLPRPGRRTALHRTHRQAVWVLYQQYEGLLRERGFHDFHDILLMALDQVRARPIEPAYDAVIVDEVQDLPLIGIQLLHALTGDKPNGLLLIGDNQQSVYPGGFRLTDAGITITGGRAQRLHVNYRNAADILDAALAVVEGQPFEDLDGSVVSERPAVELTYYDGAVVRVSARSLPEHDALLVEAVRKLAGPVDTSDDAPRSPLADTALLCARTNDVDRYRTMLTRAGIPTLKLDEYDGRPSNHLKLGTFRRAKGLEFKHVLLPRYHDAIGEAAQGGFADADRRALATHQLFVGMTRARDWLWLGSVEP